MHTCSIFHTNDTHYHQMTMTGTSMRVKRSRNTSQKPVSFFHRYVSLELNEYYREVDPAV